MVDRKANLLVACRYVELNLVRAGMVRQPEKWRWSSHLAHIRRAGGPAWLNSSDLYAQLLGRLACSEADRQLAAARYAEWVREGRQQKLWDEALRQQIYPGDASFVARMQATCRLGDALASEVPRVQREHPRRPLAWYLDARPSRNDAIRTACLEGHYSMTEVGRAVELSVSRISRIVRGDAPQADAPAHRA